MVSLGMGAVSAIGAAIYWTIGIAVDVHWEMPILLGLCVTLTGACAAMMNYLMRHDRFRTASASLVVRTGTAVVAQLAMAFAAASAASLILGFTLGLVVQAAFLALALRISAQRLPFRRRDVGAMYRRYRRQVAVDIPSTLIAAFSLNLPTFLLGLLFNSRVVGFYSIGNRLAVTPLQLFNDALGQTFFQKAARANEAKGHFWDEMKFALLTSGIISLGVLAAILLLARPFIILYLGRDWTPAADMLVILAPMLAMRSLTMSIATTVFVLRKAHWLLFHNIATVALTMLAYAIAAALSMTPIGFLGVTALLLGLEYAVFALFLIWASGRQKRVVTNI
jgi:O-antigen/teichoic acid export membrane protein